MKDVPTARASQLQEAIDTIAQTFDHPDSLSIQYTFEEGEKQTIFTIQRADGQNTYRLRYDGSEADSEPVLTIQK